MKPAWKHVRLIFIPAAWLMCSGCSGINGSYSVSPATFLLPGLMQAEPEKPVLPTEPEQQPIQVASSFQK